MAKLIQKVRKSLSWGRIFGIFNLSWKREMTESLNDAFRNLPM